jgi:hypothetical protein
MSRNNNTTTNSSRLLQRRWESSSSNKNTNNLPPLPSPAKAKKKYLETKPPTTPQDITTKMAQLHKELEVVRSAQTKRLDLALNKPWYRKLYDPLKRYKHSVINMAAVTLAYMLAHHLFLSKKRETQSQQELNTMKEEAQELQNLLGTLVNPAQVEQMATKMLETLQEEKQEDIKDSTTTTGTRKGWFSKSSSGRSSSSRRSGGFLFSSSSNVVGITEERLAQVLQQELEARIGDSHLAPGDRKQKSVEQLLQDNKAHLQASQVLQQELEGRIGDSHLEPEKRKLQDNKAQLQATEQEAEDDASTMMMIQMLEQAEQKEETTVDGQNVVKKRIFSM